MAPVMDALSKLFCTSARLKLLRLFLFNTNTFFSAREASFRAKISLPVAHKELATLAGIGIIRRRKAKGQIGYSANRSFAYFEPLAAFLRETTVVGPQEILKILRKVGNLRLVVLTGLFSGALEPKVDLLIVGDRLHESVLARAVHTIEADLGREIRYAVFSTQDFRYRSGVYDRLLRDVFDYKHKVILDKLGNQ